MEVDATQIRQVIMNLVINASEALGEKSGVIAITTGCMDCDKSYLEDVWLDENLKEGLYVYLEIADTGCGMNKSHDQGIRSILHYEIYGPGAGNGCRAWHSARPPGGNKDL